MKHTPQLLIKMEGWEDKKQLMHEIKKLDGILMNRRTNHVHLTVFKSVKAPKTFQDIAKICEDVCVLVTGLLWMFNPLPACISGTAADAPVLLGEKVILLKKSILQWTQQIKYNTLSINPSQ